MSILIYRLSTTIYCYESKTVIGPAHRGCAGGCRQPTNKHWQGKYGANGAKNFFHMGIMNTPSIHPLYLLSNRVNFKSLTGQKNGIVWPYLSWPTHCSKGAETCVCGSGSAGSNASASVRPCTFCARDVNQSKLSCLRDEKRKEAFAMKVKYNCTFGQNGYEL